MTSSTHPDQNAWHANDDPGLSWSASDPTGIADYLWNRDRSPSTTPTTSRSTATTTTFSDLADGMHYFHVRAQDGAGNVGRVKHFTLRIDDTPPPPPSVSSSTHPSAARCYASNTPSFTWTASDTSGITGYSYALDGSSATLPDDVSDGVTPSQDYGPQPEGDSWFHVKARNGAKLWGATRHFRLRTDTVPPSSVEVTSSTHPTGGAGSASRDVSASWTSATDATCGVAGYSVVVDAAPDTVPSTPLQTATNLDTVVPHPGVWYLHVRATDRAGNAGPTAHYEFVVLSDGAPSVTSATHPSPDLWSPADDLELTWIPADPADGYSYALDQDPESIPDVRRHVR